MALLLALVGFGFVLVDDDFLGKAAAEIEMDDVAIADKGQKPFVTPLLRAFGPGVSPLTCLTLIYH